MKIKTIDNNEIIEISDNIFNKKYNSNLVNQIINTELSLKRNNTKLNKNRSKIAGSNKKPWRQKGTGKARAGTKKSPIWRSGGVTFGNQIKSYKLKINKKMYKYALKCILSKLLLINKIFIFNSFILESNKIKELKNKIKDFKKILIILLNNKNINLYSNNLYYVDIIFVNNINLSKIINYNSILITLESIRFLENKIL